MMPTADAEREASEAMAICFGELERIAQELPPALAGLTAIEIHKRINSSIEQLRKSLKQKFEGVGK